MKGAHEARCTAAHQSLLAAFDADAEISLMLIDDQLVAQGGLIDEGLYVDRFVQSFKTRGIEHLRIDCGVTLQEVTALVSMVKTNAWVDESVSLPHVHFGKVAMALRDGDAGSADEQPGRQVSVRDVCEDEVSMLMEIYETVKKHRRIRIVGIYDIVRGLIHAFRQESDSLLALAPLRAMDEYTFTHSTNVCILNLAQAMALGIEGPMLHDIGVAAMLHDIGKLFVPEDILGKPGRLTDAEWDVIRQHPLRGAQYLVDIPGVPRLAVIAAYEHHLKYNLSGYPKVSEGWRQNLCSQMTTISDYFDAMRTKRQYRGAMEIEAVTGIMRGLAGTELHPALTASFIQLLASMDRHRRTPDQTTEPESAEHAQEKVTFTYS